MATGGPPDDRERRLRRESPRPEVPEWRNASSGPQIITPAYTRQNTYRFLVQSFDPRFHYF